MNEQEALKDFVARNVTLLTGENLDRRELKDAIHEFYIVQHKKHFSTPSNLEIMEALLARLQTSMSEQELHHLINNLPLFRLMGESQKQRLHESVSDKKIKSVLTEQQLNDLRQVGAFEAVERHRGKEIAQHQQRKLEDIEKKIEAKRKEYESLPSILDRETVLEPSFDPTVEDIKPWWERFYLRGNPFPRKDGLSEISTSLYESVIIKTEPFQKTLSNLQRNPAHLFNSGFLLVGDYGYGKTTFIDYLSNYLISRDVLPIRITSARFYADASGFNDSFLQKFRMELHRELLQMSAVPLSNLQDLEIEDQIAALCVRIVPKRRKGIVVFLDDYHKFRSHFPQIFEFLGTLQVLKDDLTRKQLCVGFIVSGTPIWHEELRRNTQMMGFLDNAPIILPSISPDLICEVFNKRIEAFCFESTPRRIRPEFVRKLVSDLAGEQGIRGCIVKIVDELTNNNLAIVNSPVELAADTLKELRQILEKDDVLRKSINKLLYETKFSRFTKEQIARCLELLVQISVQDGIPETDKQFLEHKFHFQVLRDCALIQKQKVGFGTLCHWTLNYRLRIATELIFKQHSLALSDYLLKLYAYKDYSERAAVPEQITPLRELRSFFSRQEIRLEKPVVENINRGLHLLEGLLLRDPTVPPSDKNYESAIQALDHLTTALCNIDHSDAIFVLSGFRDAKVRWDLHPNPPESISEALHRVDDYAHNDGSQRLAYAVRSLTHALEEVADRIKLQVTESCLERRSLLLRPAFHTTEENDLFGRYSASYLSANREDHYTAVKSLTDYLELRFRKFFFLCADLVFGDKYFDQFPPAAQGYVAKNLSMHPNFVGVQNKFDGLTRSQFKFLFAENNGLRDSIVKPLDLPWKEADWKTFVDVFAVENIKVAHQQIDTFSSAEKDRYRAYACLAEELLCAMNRMITRIFDRNIFMSATKDGSSDASDYIFRCSFKPVQFLPEEGPEKYRLAGWPKKFPSNSEEHLLDGHTVDKLSNILSAKATVSPHGVVFQDLLDIEYVEEHFGMRIRDFVLALAFVTHASKTFTVCPWFGSTIVIRVRDPKDN